MKQAAVFALLLMFGALVAAQVPSSGPATTEADSQPVYSTTGVATLPDTAPSTLPVTMPVSSTEPTTSATRSTSTAPPTTEATDYSTESQGSSYSRSRRSRRDYRPPTPPPPVVASSGSLLTPKPISREFYPVLSRSIFIKGRQDVVDTGASSDSYRSMAPTTDMATTGPTSAPAPWMPESMLVFNGASDANGQIVAFIENSGLNTIAKYQVGDAVAQGKIAAITLDSLDYKVGSQVTHVMLGQNLQGIDMQVLTTQPVSSTTAPTTEDSSGTTTGSSGTDSVLERLRRRRLQELGQ